MTATNVTAEQTIYLSRSWKHEYQPIKSNLKTSLFDIYRCYNWLGRTAGWFVWNVQKRSDSYTEISDIRFKFRLRSVAIYCSPLWKTIRHRRRILSPILRCCQDEQAGRMILAARSVELQCFKQGLGNISGCVVFRGRLGHTLPSWSYNARHHSPLPRFHRC